MDFGKKIKILLIAACFILCIGGCESQPDSKDDNSKREQFDLPSDIKDTPVPTNEAQIGSNSAITTGGVIITGGAVATGGAVITDGAFGEGGKVSSGAVDISDGMATTVQKDEYTELSVRMEELYGIITTADSLQMEEDAYEDFRYFEPIYEYYHGLWEEKCENIREDEMERILKGIGEYLTALEEFAKGHGIELPSAD